MTTHSQMYVLADKHQLSLLMCCLHLLYVILPIVANYNFHTLDRRQ